MYRIINPTQIVQKLITLIKSKQKIQTFLGAVRVQSTSNNAIKPAFLAAIVVNFHQTLTKFQIFNHRIGQKDASNS